MKDYAKIQHKVTVRNLSSDEESVFMMQSPADALINANMLDTMQASSMQDPGARARVFAKIGIGEKTLSIGDLCVLRQNG